jgi:excisionase family DNA binding protein
MDSGPHGMRQHLLSTGEVAHLLGSSRQHVVDMCTRGELPFLWIGRHRRIERSDIDRLLARVSKDLEAPPWFPQVRQFSIFILAYYPRQRLGV